MGKSIISEGQTYNEAVEKGLKELNLSKKDVEIKRIDDGEKRSFFSILDPKAVKVEIIEKEHKEEEKKEVKEVKKEEKIIPEEELVAAKKLVDDFLEVYLKHYNEMKFKSEIRDNRIFVDVDGKDSGHLIGYRGDTINALEVILSAIANKATKERVRVILDIASYKEKRENTLKDLSHKLEKTVIRSGKKVVLEPMNAHERKIIHTELQSSESVTTYSVGEEPRRKVVVERKKNN